MLLLIINYRSASHHLKNRAVPPWKNFYFNQFSIMLSPDPAQLHTGGSPRTWAKKGSSCRGTKQHIPPKTWKKSKKETFIPIWDQCHRCKHFSWNAGLGYNTYWRSDQNGRIFDSFFILKKINIPRVHEPAQTGKKALITICCWSFLLYLLSALSCSFSFLFWNH